MSGTFSNLAWSGGTAVGGHATFLGTCPATGPTVAPTSEGHYYWTSTIGEKWLWIYGDVAPFIVGNFYSETIAVPSTYIYPASSGEVARATFVAPRSGNIRALVSTYWVYNVNEYAFIRPSVLTLLPSGISVGLLNTTTNVLVTTPSDSMSTVLYNASVITGDTIVFKLLNTSSTKQHTSINETFKIYYEN